MFELNDRTHRSVAQCPHKKRADEAVRKSKQKEWRGEKIYPRVVIIMWCR